MLKPYRVAFFAAGYPRLIHLKFLSLKELEDWITEKKKDALLNERNKKSPSRYFEERIKELDALLEKGTYHFVYGFIKLA